VTKDATISCVPPKSVVATKIFDAHNAAAAYPTED